MWLLGVGPGWGQAVWPLSEDRGPAAGEALDITSVNSFTLIIPDISISKLYSY